MPSPQSLVAFLALLFLLLLATRVQFGLEPVVSAVLSSALALTGAWVVDRHLPREVDGDDEPGETEQ